MVCGYLVDYYGNLVLCLIWDGGNCVNKLIILSLLYVKLGKWEVLRKFLNYMKIIVYFMNIILFCMCVDLGYYDFFLIMYICCVIIKVIF